jgi:hypothetical protein
MLRQHMLWVFDRRQVVDPIPFLQQVYIGQEMLVLGVRQMQTQNFGPLIKTLR